MLNAFSNGIVRLLGVEPVDELNTALTVNEFHTLLAGAVKEGKIEDMEHELLAGALDFRARTAGSIMTPRREFRSVPGRHRSPTSSAWSPTPATAASGRGAGDNDIIGFVHSKDLLRLPPEAVAIRSRSS
ncbi:MAG: hypothetical protein R2695_09110 [Acidimicrobiales bacterium]